MLVGPQIVDPELPRPGLLAPRSLVEEEDIGLPSGRIPDPGREPQESVDLALPE